MLNVAIIGMGYIGKVHLETLRRIPGVRVNAVVDNTPGLVEQLKAAYPDIETVTTDYRELLEDSSLQVFHNCTPNHLHFEINKTVLEAGKHVLSEKPLAMTAEEAGILREVAMQKNVVAGINFCYRYYPVVQDAAARVRSGEIGDVHTIFGSYFQDWLLYESDYNWRLDKDFAGASNTIADIGSHWLDLAQFVGNAKIVEVLGDLKTIHPIRKKSRADILTFARQPGNIGPDSVDVPVAVDDYGSVLLHFKNGASGTFSACQLCAGRKCTIDLQVYGKKSSLAWNHEHPSQLWIGSREQANQVFFENPLQQHDSTSRFARLPSGHPMGYFDAEYNLFSEFYLGVQGKRDDATWPTFQDGYEEMVIVEAILKSSEQKKWVPIVLS